MIFGKSISSLWKKYRVEFLSLYSQELTGKIKAANLEFRYTDLSGLAYFGFPKDMGLPVERLGKLYYYTELLFKGLSPAEDEMIDRRINEALETGLTNPKEKAAAKIGALLMEREKRRKLVFHSELIYNILAVQWIREDEEVGVFNNEIQMQKVDQFKKEVEQKGAFPFFQVEELKQLNSFLKMSSDEWQAYWNESQVQIRVLEEALKILSSSPEGSEQSKTTSGAES